MDPHTRLAIVLTLAGIGLTFGYALACWIWPFRNCQRCSGTGKRRSLSGRAFRYCRRCHGTGRRLRAGRWIYNAFSRVRRDAR